MTKLPASSNGKPRPPKPVARVRRNPDQLALGERPVDQGELFEGQPGGKQSAARLRQIRESMEAIDSLFHEAIQSRGVRVFDEFLEFVRRFNRFSAFNAMLIDNQRPGATAVGFRDQWLAIGRRIKPGAIPIAILWPFAPVRWVYELNDTYGRSVPTHTSDPFAVLGKPPGASWSVTLQAADRRGIRVELTDRRGNRSAGLAGVLHAAADGSTLSSTGRKHRWLVLVNEQLDIGARFATLAHELGHIYCGHLGAHPEGFWPDRSGTLNKAQREMEAEAVAYLVCKRLGLETQSADYLKGDVTPQNLLAVSKRLIIEATNRIEARS